MMDLSEQAILFLKGIGIGGFILIAKELYRVAMRFRKVKIKRAIDDNLRIQNALNNIIHETRADKAAILCMHNGGNEPMVGKRLYSSLIAEAVSKKGRITGSRWEKQRLDNSYISLAADLLKKDNPRLTIVTRELPEGSVLREVFEADNIAQSFSGIVFVFNPKPFKFLSGFQDMQAGALWYFSVTFDTEEPITIYDKDIIRSNVNTIHNILKEQYKYD